MSAFSTALGSFFSVGGQQQSQEKELVLTAELQQKLLVQELAGLKGRVVKLNSCGYTPLYDLKGIEEALYMLEAYIEYPTLKNVKTLKKLSCCVKNIQKGMKDNSKKQVGLSLENLDYRIKRAIEKEGGPVFDDVWSSCIFLERATCVGEEYDHRRCFLKTKNGETYLDPDEKV